MTATLALVTVVATGLYFVCLAIVSFTAPARTIRFLQAFASSARMHYLELVGRLIVGTAFLVRAPHMLWPGVFLPFGWILIITTVILFLVPWQWHRRFAQLSVPYAVRYLPLVASTSLVFGIFIIAAAMGGASQNLP